jgi:hypothetical protein
MLWFLIWAAKHIVDWDFIGWEAVGAIATCILAGGVGVAIWQIIVTRKNTNKQLEETRKSTNAEITVGLFDKLRDKQILDTERDIIYKIDAETIKGFATADATTEREDIGRVLDWLDMLGILASKEIVDKDLTIMGFAGVTAVRCWYKLTSFIKEMRPKRGFYAEY